MRFGAAGIEEIGLDEGCRSADRSITGEMEGEGRPVPHACVGDAYFVYRAGFPERCGRNASLFLRARADGRSSRGVVRGRA